MCFARLHGVVLRLLHTAMMRVYCSSVNLIMISFILSTKGAAAAFSREAPTPFCVYLLHFQFLRFRHLASWFTVFSIRFTCFCSGSRSGIRYTGKLLTGSFLVGPTFAFISLWSLSQRSSLSRTFLCNFAIINASLRKFALDASGINQFVLDRT